jgi:hypothetical protein
MYNKGCYEIILRILSSIGHVSKDRKEKGVKSSSIVLVTKTIKPHYFSLSIFVSRSLCFYLYSATCLHPSIRRAQGSNWQVVSNTKIDHVYLYTEKFSVQQPFLYKSVISIYLIIKCLLMNQRPN